MLCATLSFTFNVCVTVQLSLDHVHPGADLLVQGLDVLQQVQLTLGHRRRARLRCARPSVRLLAAACVILCFYVVHICECGGVSVCGGVSCAPVDIFRFYFLHGENDRCF